MDAPAPPRPADARVAERVRAEQLAAVFADAPNGVLGAWVAALVATGALLANGDVALPRFALWSSAISLVAVFHLAAVAGYRRRWLADFGNPWPAAFVAAAACEGVWWGLAASLLTPSANMDERLLMTMVAYVVVVGAVPAFGPYLPAFAAIFLPTTLIALAGQAIAFDRFDLTLAVLTIVGIVVIWDLARRTNANFEAQLRLRFAKDALAEDLRAQKELAEEASLSKSRFLAAASHDLRQPIHALGMFVGALSRHPMTDEMRRLIRHIEGSIAAMDGLFGSLLDISRLDAGVVRPQVETVALAPLLERVCRDYADDAAVKGLRLVLAPTGAHARTDPALLERILRNIVANAVRHTDSGTVLVGCRRGATLRVQTLDTGRGIAPAERERVFEEFYQLANPERDRAKGLGLGLAIVKRLANLLDHPIELVSEPGRGTRFTVTLPAAPQPTGSEPTVAPVPTHGFAGRLFLVVDDEAMVLEAMRSLLAGWGAQVIVAESCAQMLDKVAACPLAPDLILCDYRLRDGENGVEAIQRLQEQFNDDLPAVLITGDTGSDRLREVRDSGVVVLHKPVANGKLRATIGNLLKGRERAAALGARALR